MTKQRRAAVTWIAAARWEFMHAHIYAAGYALNPQYQVHNVSVSEEVTSGLRDMTMKLLSMQDAAVALQQFDDHKPKLGVFGDKTAQQHALVPHKWWPVYGSCSPALQKLALKVCSQVTTASACERNWSAYDHVASRKRNKLDPARAEKLVFVFQNLRVMYRSQDTNLS